MLSIQQLASHYLKWADQDSNSVSSSTILDRKFQWSKEKAIMGVINLSRDSWYRESVCVSTEMAVTRAKILHHQGAHLVDLGAESTLPGAEKVHGTDQADSLIPIIKECTQEKIPISIESYQLETIRRCLDAGAAVINLTGNTMCEETYRMIADSGAAAIICFIQGANVRDVNQLTITEDPIPALLDYFSKATEIASRAGVKNVFIDPGMGFYYKNLNDSQQRIDYQTRTFLNSFRLKSLGFPICHALPHAFDVFGDEVRSAESYFAVLACLGGTDLFRTHEVAKVRPVLECMMAGNTG